MKKISIILCLCIFLFSSNLFAAQDFSLLTKKIIELENGINSITGNYQSVKSYNVNELKKIKDELSILRANIYKAEQLSSITLSESQLQDILNDLEYLKAENRYLRSVYEKNNKQLASLNMEYYPTKEPIDFATRISNIDNKLKRINNSDENHWYETIEVSGFFDMVSTFQNNDNNRPEFGIGQAELDVSSAIDENSDFELGIAYNNVSGTFDLGFAVLSMTIFENENSSINLSLGQFYVPFGIDYNYFPSLDRKLVTPPFFNEYHQNWQGWNDAGMQIGYETQRFNTVGYIVNGFEEFAEVLNEELTLSLGVETYDEIDTSPSYAIGNRTGLNLFSNFEIGGSVAVGFNKSDKTEMVLSGADLKYEQDRFQFKSEYYYHSTNRQIAEEYLQGYYFQTLYSFDKPFITGRMSSFKIENIDWVNNYTLGLGYKLQENFELRFETIFYENSRANTNTIQVAAGF